MCKVKTQPDGYPEGISETAKTALEEAALKALRRCRWLAQLPPLHVLFDMILTSVEVRLPVLIDARVEAVETAIRKVGGERSYTLRGYVYANFRPSEIRSLKAKGSALGDRLFNDLVRCPFCKATENVVVRKTTITDHQIPGIGPISGLSQQEHISLYCTACGDARELVGVFDESLAVIDARLGIDRRKIEG